MTQKGTLIAWILSWLSNRHVMMNEGGEQWNLTAICAMGWKNLDLDAKHNFTMSKFEAIKSFCSFIKCKEDNEKLL